jgi:signal peptidase
LTKGDNNPVDDRGLYPRGQLWIKEEDVVGKVYANAPYGGMLTIWLNDYPMLKYAVIGMMLVGVLTSKDP